VAEWQVERRADGAWRVVGPDGRPQVAYVVTDPDGATWIHLDGEVVVLAAEATSRPRVQTHGHATLEAPMPAQVTAVFVAAGDDVEAGDTLLLLEAMKMELPLKAPTAGRVDAIHCAAGQRVSPGRVLVDLAPREAAS
jgi:biotin carboxyl carrier protein